MEDAAAVVAFRSGLLEWYRRHRRQLSWRDSSDPYHIWISEIMLQQTRVEQMGEYFGRFVARFPTVRDLADAPIDDVLRVWEGLGYYARARNMHRAARRIVEEHAERIPDTYDELIELPGIGEYTAAAVSSIAFDRDHPVLDGNVTRVLCRLLKIEEEPRRAAVKAKKKQKPHYQVTAGLIWKGEKLLIAQRPTDGMLGGMWEFPGGKQEPGESLQECLAREIREELDFEIEVGEHLASVDHAYTHFSISLHAFAARYVAGQPQAIGCADWRWIDPNELDHFPFPRTDRKIIEQLRQDGRQLDLFSGDRRGDE
ncbi:MAG: A/G-specific adenine glycosylase [Gemmatimonadetes bacterium]|nr:A/G-specific adenine glycosylase [Gemmatimonadota bacterium]